MGLGVMWLYATDKILSVASNYIYIELPTVALDGWARISAAKVCSCPAVCAWPSHTDLCVPHVVRMCPQGAIAVVAAVATAAVAAIWVAAATVAVAAVTVLSMFLSSAPTSDMWPTATHFLSYHAARIVDRVARTFCYRWVCVLCVAARRPFLGPLHPLSEFGFCGSLMR